MSSRKSRVYSPVTLHIVNDDLFVNPSDYADAKRQFPTIIHVLDHPELRECFEHFNDLANSAKAKSRKWGAIAIAMGALAIAFSAIEIIVHSYHKELGAGDWLNVSLWVIAVAAALSGIGGVLIGKIGVLYGARKRDWLHNRFMSERIRQFHFQTFVARIPEILASLQSNNEATGAVKVYETRRAEWFAAFQRELTGKVGAVLGQTIEARAHHAWQHPESRLGDMAYPEALNPLFDAYRKYRIKQQLDYAASQLETAGHYFAVDKPRDQAAMISGVSSWGIGVLFFVHIFVLGSVIFYALVSNTSNFSSAFSPVSGPFNAIIILIAILALVARAFQQGLQPEREIERYQKYKSNVASILERFDAATTQGQRIEVMKEMERLSFYEMVDFIITNDDAMFVM
jgi:hypothetical protein